MESKILFYVLHIQLLLKKFSLRCICNFEYNLKMVINLKFKYNSRYEISWSKIMPQFTPHLKNISFFVPVTVWMRKRSSIYTNDCVHSEFFLQTRNSFLRTSLYTGRPHDMNTWKMEKVTVQYLNNYSSSPDGLWVNSRFGLRPHGLLTQSPFGLEE